MNSCRTFVAIRSMTHSVKIFGLVLVFVARFIMGFFMQDEQTAETGRDQIHAHHAGIALQAEFCCTDENENEVEGDDDSESHLMDGFYPAHFNFHTKNSIADKASIASVNSLSGLDRIIMLRNFRL